MIGSTMRSFVFLGIIIGLVAIPFVAPEVHNEVKYELYEQGYDAVSYFVDWDNVRIYDTNVTVRPWPECFRVSEREGYDYFPAHTELGKAVKSSVDMSDIHGNLYPIIYYDDVARFVFGYWEAIGVLIALWLWRRSVL